MESHGKPWKNSANGHGGRKGVPTAAGTAGVLTTHLSSYGVEDLACTRVNWAWDGVIGGYGGLILKLGAHGGAGGQKWPMTVSLVKILRAGGAYINVVYGVRGLWARFPPQNVVGNGAD